MLRSALGGVARKGGPFFLARVPHPGGSDLVVALGAVLVATGLWWVYEPAALLWLGANLMVAGTLAAASERHRR